MGGFEERVGATCNRHRLLQPGDRVVVAVSGGPDSLALLYALHALRARLGIDLHVAHLNHRLRRAASAEARFVAQTAESLGLACSIEAVDVRALQRETGLGLEHAARRARYQFFARVAAAVGAAKVATAHTADDNVETVLMNLLRGGGTDGLAGIPPLRPLLQAGEAEPDAPVWVVRPLIETWRAAVEAYCRARALQPREDRSNRSRAFLRNRVRLDLLPYLERHYGESVKANVARLSEIARPEVAYLERVATTALDELATPIDDGIELSARALHALDLAVRRRVVRQALRRVKGDPLEIGFREIERVLNAAASAGDTQFDLPGPVRVARRGDRLRLFRPRTTAAAPFGQRALALPGETPAPDGGTLTAAVIARPAGFAPARVRRAREVFLDADALAPPLNVRAWQPGDRFAPLGMAQHKTLQDLFIDAGVPAAQRECVPLVTDAQGIVWVAGVEIAHRARVTESTCRLLRLHWERAEREEIE